MCLVLLLQVIQMLLFGFRDLGSLLLKNLFRSALTCMPSLKKYLCHLFSNYLERYLWSVPSYGVALFDGIDFYTGLVLKSVFFGDVFGPFLA
jgi:hypothetical protein